MSIVKKWTSCVVSFIAGVLGLALSACSGMVVKIDALKVKETTKAFKVITDADLYKDAKTAGTGTEFLWLKVFAIITLIISILLIVYAIVMLLKNLDVIKSSSNVFDYIGYAVIALFLVATIGLMITSNTFASETEALAANPMFKVVVSVGAYQPIMLTVAIISAVAVAVVEFFKKKSK